MLEVRKVSIAFTENPVLESVSLTVEKNSVLGILGPSGSGKSTILKIIAGLITPDTGTVWIEGNDMTGVPAYRRNIGFVFQNNMLFPHMTVEKNIAYGLGSQKTPKDIQKKRIHEMLELVGLVGFEKRKVTDLSGGEAKRVALARSLAPEPSLILLDEPFTGLDRDLHDELVGEVKNLLGTTHTTAVLVTHDRQEVDALCDGIYEM